MRLITALCAVLLFLFFSCEGFAANRPDPEEIRKNFQLLIEEFKDINQIIKDRKENRRPVSALENTQFQLVNEIIKGIKREQTTDQQILDWLGAPVWEMTTEEFTAAKQGDSIDVHEWSKALCVEPGENQKMYGYLYDSANERMRLLLFVDRNTMIVKDHCEMIAHGL